MPDGFIFEAGCPVIEWPGCYAGKYLVSVDSVHNFVQHGYLSKKMNFFLRSLDFGSVYFAVVNSMSSIRQPYGSCLF